MADALPLERRGPHTGRGSVSVTALGPAARFSFRGGPAAVTALGQAYRCVPRQDACSAAADGDRAALWLGPDEWLLVGPDGDTASLFASLGAALADQPHSLVDVSHRNTAFDVVGDAASDILSEGCPLDFGDRAFPVGMCTRTVLAKAEVVFWRYAPDRYRLECWRSFAPYVRAFLGQAIENLG